MKRRKGNEENERLLENLVSGLKNRQPVLNDPDVLTDNIMKAIREEPDGMHLKITARSGRHPFVIILTRLLAAASVCLFLVFTYEEYILMDKITRLEKQNAAISLDSQYNAALRIKKTISILAFDPEMRDQYKEFITRKINLRILFRAAMFVDAADLMDPEKLKLFNKADKNASIPHLFSLFEQFDSTDNIIRR